MIIDTAVYDLSKFAKFHPGGLSVLLDDDVAGKDATTTFFGLHNMEVLMKPQNDRMIIARIADEKPKIRRPQPGDLSRVPYGEPQWLVPEFKNPYYDESHHRLREDMRKFVDTKIYPEAQANDATGKEASAQVKSDMATSMLNHMRLGPGKHLHGLTLMGGIKGEDYNYFQ